MGKPRVQEGVVARRLIQGIREVQNGCLHHGSAIFYAEHSLVLVCQNVICKRYAFGIQHCFPVFRQQPTHGHVIFGSRRCDHAHNNRICAVVGDGLMIRVRIKQSLSAVRGGGEVESFET